MTNERPTGPAREALESAEQPAPATVAVTVSVAITASSSASGTTQWIGTTTGQMLPKPEVSQWLDKVKKYVLPAAMITDYLIRWHAALN